MWYPESQSNPRQQKKNEDSWREFSSPSNPLWIRTPRATKILGDSLYVPLFPLRLSTGKHWASSPSFLQVKLRQPILVPVKNQFRRCHQSQGKAPIFPPLSISLLLMMFNAVTDHWFCQRSTSKRNLCFSNFFLIFPTNRPLLLATHCCPHRPPLSDLRLCHYTLSEHQPPTHVPPLFGQKKEEEKRRRRREEKKRKEKQKK